MKKKRADTPGPKPETLVIDANWKDAVQHAMAKGKPPKEVKPATKKRRPE